MTPRSEIFRILLVDDNPAIHDDFQKILAGRGETENSLEAAEAILFGAPLRSAVAVEFEIHSAYQGQEALEKVQTAVNSSKPFALAFVDVRMPPGWDGIETVEHLWRADPALQVVICTAYADYSWEKMAARLGTSDNCVILKKPFDNVEVLQLAHAMTRKWRVTQQAQMQLETLERMVEERTRALQSANMELRRSEERFATAFRASPVPLAIQALDSRRFVDANEAFASMTGYSREELLGKTPVELPLCIDYPEPGGRVTSLRGVEAHVSTASGELRPALLSVERITITGEPHLLMIVQDLTERIQLETQLRQAQKMEAIGQLAAGIAHDFNNLLTIIEGHASLQLQIREQDKDVAGSLSQIEAAAQRASDLTRQLLAFSRRQIMRPKVLDLSKVVENLTSMLRRLIGEQVELNCALSSELPPVYGDPTSIEQITINLVVNARDAMPRGGKVTVSTSRVTVTADDRERNSEARPGDYVRLSVSDTGVGMDTATRGRIFEPFFTTKEVHKGTGMGLATVYGLAKQHDAWIEVITAPGEGSIFHLFFPITNRKPEPPEERKPALTGPGGGHTILIVEDDSAVRSLVREVLVFHGYRILEAEDAASALRVWEERGGEVELLLTDVVMPGEMNGLELAAKLLAEKPDLKVIYTSGYSADLFSSGIHLEDGVNYLPKPYLSEKLTNIVRNALESEESLVQV